MITQQLGDKSLSEAIFYGLAISLLLIATRMICALGASGFTMFMSRFITVADARPGWRGPLIIGWAGMRGVVSLAAALSIPLLINEGQPFPFRNLILFITFVVILVTLVLQGLTLPWFISKFQPEDHSKSLPEQKQEIIIQKKMAQYSLQYLEDNYGGLWSQNEHLKNLHARFSTDASFFARELNAADNSGNGTLIQFQKAYFELLDHQRKLLREMNRREEFDEEVIRKYMSLIDIEEFKLREKMVGEEPLV